jgi:hypothetical protein
LQIYIEIELREVGLGVVDLNHLGQDMYQWLALVNKVIQFMFLKTRGFLDQVKMCLILVGLDKRKCVK